jgi:hypothetical protein
MADTPVAKKCTPVVGFDTIIGKIDTPPRFLFAANFPAPVILSSRFI